MLRDGSRSLPPRTAEIEGPLRSTRLEATAYGPLVVTVFAGEAGQRLGLPGIPQVEPSGTVMASPAAIFDVVMDRVIVAGGELEGREQRRRHRPRRDREALSQLEILEPAVFRQLVGIGRKRLLGHGPPRWD